MKRERVGKWVLSVLLWFFGGTLYFFSEVIWKTARGRPETISWTMLAVALILCIPLERLGAELPWKLSLPYQATICAAAITAVEFVAGCILNLWLGLGIWDYSEMPYNLCGQICLPFCFVWFVASIFGIVLFDWMRYAVEGGERPHYYLITE